MPSYSQMQQDYHKALIRRVMVVSGQGAINFGSDVTIRYIKEQLEQNGLRLDHEYIAKIKNKILAERIKRIEKGTRKITRDDLAALLSVNLTALYEIIYSKAKPNDKISAMKEVRETYLAIYEKESTLNAFATNVSNAVPRFQVTDAKLLAIVDAMIAMNVLPKQIYGIPDKTSDSGNLPGPVSPAGSGG